MKDYLKYAKLCNTWQTEYQCWHGDNEWGALNESGKTGSGLAIGMILTDGTLIAVENTKTDCYMGSGGVCTALNIDVNGFKEPNRVGKDIFGIILLRNQIKPRTLDNGGWWWDVYCIQPPAAGWDGEQNSGFACSAKVIMNEDY